MNDMAPVPTASAMPTKREKGNISLWEKVCKTDPAAVKPITGKPYNGNSPNPHWLFFRATEVFGPCGIGWGVKIISERVEPGAEGDKVHVAHVLVWYTLDGKRGEVEHVGQTMFSGHRKPKQGQQVGEPYTDEDAPKKSVTDATVKALSMIGFAGDIFSGRWDDSKYVAELGREFAEARCEADKALPAATGAKEERQRAYVESFKAQVATITDRANLVDWWVSQSDPMADAGIAKDTSLWSSLRSVWIERGKAIVAGLLPAQASAQPARRAPSPSTAPQQSSRATETAPTAAASAPDPEALRKRFTKVCAAAKDREQLGEAWNDIVDPYVDAMFPTDKDDLDRMYRLRAAELDGEEGAQP